jgi:hypothetical protein
MKPHQAAIVVLAMVLLGCSGGSPQVGTVKLASGKQVALLGVGQMNFSQGGPALMIKYQTDLKMDDMDKLRNEATEVWQAFQTEAEKSNLKNGIVSANEKPKGWIITHNSSYNFVFQKSDDGSWKVLETKK